MATRMIQLNRFKQTKIKTNAEMSLKQIREFCLISPSGELLLKQAEKQFILSPRAIHRILKISRTIADSAGSENIKDEHLAEALQYRDTNT
jgi:magnesium chelatase family protein